MLSLMIYHSFLESIDDSVKVPERYMDYADTLTPYGVVVRSPNELYIEEHNVQTAFQYGNDILQWAEDITESQCEDSDICNNVEIIEDGCVEQK